MLKYGVGYFNFIYELNDLETLSELKKYSLLCDSFIVGIPDEATLSRIIGYVYPGAVQKTKEFLEDIKWIDKVLLLDGDHLDRKKVYAEINFDVCFYGSEYGRPFEEDKAFMREHGVDFISVMPDRFKPVSAQDAFMIALEDVRKDQKIVLFGTGKYFDNYMKHYAHRKGSHPGKSYMPAYAVDNAKEKQGTYKDGVLIKAPEALLEESPEDVLVVICSVSCQSIIGQLKDMGDFNYRTLLINQSIALLDEYDIALRGEQEYLKRCHEVLPEMLQEFDRVCTKYGLKYYLICGSLIGAVRHKGMIPWDDDLDLAVTREDFIRLKQVAPAEWDVASYELLDYDEFGNGAFLDFMPRLICRKVHLPLKSFDKVADKATADVDNRPFIDIYIMDTASDNDRRHMRYMRMIKAVYSLCMGHRGMLDYSEYEGKKTEGFILALKIMNLIGRVIPLKVLSSWFDRLCLYASKEGGECCFMPGTSITGVERKFKKRYFGEPVRVPFGNGTALIPEDHDGVLTEMGYDNYMQPLPEALRRPSHYFNSDITIW